MATAPIVDLDTLQADPLSDFVLVRTDQVDRVDRLRQIDTVWARALGEVMRRDGQKTPIEVCRLPGSSRWTLVSGGHRHAGAEFADIVYLRAEIVSAGRDDRRLREVSENLWRRDLEPIDRAAFIAELVEIKRRTAGLEVAAHRTGSVPAKWQAAINAEAAQTLETISNVYGWSEEIGADLGFTGRTIRNDLLLYRRLPAGVIADLRAAKHAILGNATQLKALAKLEQGEQRRVAMRLTHGARTVAEAIGQLEGKAVADPEAKRLSAFIGAFGRMSLAEKKGALAHLAGMLPAGTALGSPEDGPIAREAHAALDAAFEFFLKVEEWDPASPIANLSDDLRQARHAVQLALFSVNDARRKA